MKTRFSSDAETDLAEIRAFISIDNPVRAATFTRELVVASVAIGDAPLGYPLLSPRSISDVRRKVYKGYSIIYRVTGSTVEISRILHGARDIERLLDG